MVPSPFSSLHIGFDLRFCMKLKKKAQMMLIIRLNISFWEYCEKSKRTIRHLYDKYTLEWEWFYVTCSIMLINVIFLRSLFSEVEVEVPYFFKEFEPYSSLIGSLFFKLSFIQKRAKKSLFQLSSSLLNCERCWLDNVFEII